MNFDKISDQIEKLLARPTSFVLFLLWCIFMPFINIDAANYGISVATALLLFLTLGSSRRDRKAMHVKLDDLEIAVDKADNDNAGLEGLTEEQILEKQSSLHCKADGE